MRTNGEQDILVALLRDADTVEGKSRHHLGTLHSAVGVVTTVQD
jgi:hypothetical protein